MGWTGALEKAGGVHHNRVDSTRCTSYDDAVMETIMDEWGEGMEDFIICMGGFLAGFIVGVLRGRRSIVREAQALVSETIMEVRNYERSRKPS